MKQTLNLRLSQQLAMTPQLQQSIRLLQLSTVELDQELSTFIAENPLLEREDFDSEAPKERADGAANDEHAAAEKDSPDQAADEPAEFDWSEEGFSGSRHDDGEDSDAQQASGTLTLREHLMSQLGLTRLTARDRGLVAALIEALDERGYLTESLEDIGAMLPAELEVSLQELETALKLLQQFEPTGIAARTASECLELQLNALPPETPQRDLAKRIVRDYLEALAARDAARLKRQLHCSDEELRHAQQLIRSLNPYPGSEYDSAQARYVVADVIVRKVKNAWVASLNPDALPKLRINRAYADILRDKRHSAGQGLSSQLQEARWLIKNVQQRFETILRVAQAIIDQQRHFFDHGEVAMRPLVMREIATRLDLHESTVSRVTRQKFMATPRGIFELKYFFGSQVATESGGACSATAIRALLKQMLMGEDQRKPLSDGKLAELLGQQGIVVARRTIAKYRDSLNVPPVNMRIAL